MKLIFISAFLLLFRITFAQNIIFNNVETKSTKIDVPYDTMFVISTDIDYCVGCINQNFNLLLLKVEKKGLKTGVCLKVNSKGESQFMKEISKADTIFETFNKNLISGGYLILGTERYFFDIEKNNVFKISDEIDLLLDKDERFTKPILTNLSALSSICYIKEINNNLYIFDNLYRTLFVLDSDFKVINKIKFNKNLQFIQNSNSVKQLLEKEDIFMVDEIKDIYVTDDLKYIYCFYNRALVEVNKEIVGNDTTVKSLRNANILAKYKFESSPEIVRSIELPLDNYENIIRMRDNNLFIRLKYIPNLQTDSTTSILKINFDENISKFERKIAPEYIVNKHTPRIEYRDEIGYYYIFNDRIVIPTETSDIVIKSPSSFGNFRLESCVVRDSVFCVQWVSNSNTLIQLYNKQGKPLNYISFQSPDNYVSSHLFVFENQFYLLIKTKFKQFFHKIDF